MYPDRRTGIGRTGNGRGKFRDECIVAAISYPVVSAVSCRKICGCIASNVEVAYAVERDRFAVIVARSSKISRELEISRSIARRIELQHKRVVRATSVGSLYRVDHGKANCGVARNVNDAAVVHGHGFG